MGQCPALARRLFGASQSAGSCGRSEIYITSRTKQGQVSRRPNGSGNLAVTTGPTTHQPQNAAEVDFGSESSGTGRCVLDLSGPSRGKRSKPYSHQGQRA